MIGRLCGTIEAEGGDGSVIVTVQGLGYEVFLPLGARGRLREDPAGACLVHVHTHVREDALTLYGFASLDDRNAFRVLLRVSGIGPKAALAIMSVLDARSLQAAVAGQNKAAFKGIHGVGRKTIERLLMDLKDKLDFVSGAPEPVRPRLVSAAPDSPSEAVIGALVQMGYKRNAAEIAVSAAGTGEQGEGVEDLLRAALGALS